MASNELSGKVFLITGGTEGIGKAASMDFARRGATLVLIGRNPEKTERVANELRAAASNEAKVETIFADMSSLAAVRKAAAEFRAKHDRLDVLVNNAGAVFASYHQTVDGFEMTFALNHLGHFLLTHEVKDVLTRNPGARVISTSSGAHNGGRIDLATVATRPKKDVGFRAYTDAKLCNVLFTRELARRWKDKGVAVNCYHPGFVQTGFGQNEPGFMARAIKLAGSLFARTPEKGAETLIWLATSPEGGQHTGEYFHDRAVAKIAPRGMDDNLAAGLWSLSEKLCGLAEGSA